MLNEHFDDVGRLLEQLERNYGSVCGLVSIAPERIVARIVAIEVLSGVSITTSVNGITDRVLTMANRDAVWRNCRKNQPQKYLLWRLTLGGKLPRISYLQTNLDRRGAIRIRVRRSPRSRSNNAAAVVQLPLVLVPDAGGGWLRRGPEGHTSGKTRGSGRSFVIASLSSCRRGRLKNSLRRPIW